MRLRAFLAAVVPLLAAAASFSPPLETLRAEGRLLQASLLRSGAGDGLLTIVFEGDGRAFDARGRPTDDPTPRDRTGLAIAGAWPGGDVAWVGRLCQSVNDPACTPLDWTTGRYSETAAAAASAAVDQLKARTGARRVRLAGWSGGGVIAAMVAARRSDVEGLITFAAPLDHVAWTRLTGATPLAGSVPPAPMDPAMPQAHLLGRFDTVTPGREMAASTRALAGPGAVVEVRRQAHACCWTREIRYALARLERRPQ